ncbi:heterogeneous nuclear ribonucleoprotein F isoform X2 [Exaiptasia diaphana]|nr:heterogeneous nuclear ribonucleoprotein F isoform X2 [Exaiptasia diaphana]
MNSSQFVLRARGLPWGASAEDVQDFFKDCNIVDGLNGIHFTYGLDGRPSGECFVELASEEDVEKGMAKANHHIGKRYIEVFRSKPEEMDWVIKRMGPPQDKDFESVVRLRGLPYGCSKEEIAQFFTGFEIVPNGITITLQEEGKTSGEAYVEFASPDIAEQAMQKDKEKIGHRYIELFKSAKSEIRYVTKPKPLMSTRPGPYDRTGSFGGPRFGRGDYERRHRGGGGRGNFGPVFGGGFNSGGFNEFNNFSGGRGRGGRGGRGGHGRGGGGGGGGFGFSGNSSTGHTVCMRGLPFAARENDIKQFFMPLNPVDIKIKWGSDGRCSGVAEVDFATHSDAQAAMLKDRQSMGHRYIELCLNSIPDGSGGGWNQNNRDNQGNFGGSNVSNNNMAFNNTGNFGGNNSNYTSFSNNQNQPTNQGNNYGNQQNTGNFGGQGNVGNFGGQQVINTPQQNNMSNQPFNQNTNFSNTQNTGSFGSNVGYGQSGYSNYSSTYQTQQNANFAGQAGQGSAPFNQIQQQQPQQQPQNPQQTGYTNTYPSSGGDSFFANMSQMKQDPNTQGNTMSYPGY